MAQNSLSPGFVKLKYTVAGRGHVQILPVSPEETYDPGLEPSFLTNAVAATYITMSDAIDAYDDVLDQFLNDTVGEINFAEYWQQPLPEDDPEFVFAIAIGHAGASATPTVAYSQRVTSFRTSAGGYYKHYVLDQISPVNELDSFPFAGATATLSTYLIGTTGWIRGRDGGKLISGINSFTKTNDALRKKYLLI